MQSITRSLRFKQAVEEVNAAATVAVEATAEKAADTVAEEAAEVGEAKEPVRGEN